MRKVVLAACLCVACLWMPAMGQVVDALTGRTCPEATIDIVIVTDTWPDETTWVVTDYYTGAVLCSGGPYYSSGTTYNEECCVDYDGCYDFTIYDAYGDGIYAPGGYSVTYEGTLVYTCIGSGWSGSSETVPMFGDDCPPPPTGACCDAGDVCVATNTAAECAAMSGTWYEGEDCFGSPPFVCPGLIEECPYNTIWGQDPRATTAAGWSIGTSEVNANGNNYKRFESYDVGASPILDIHWFGTMMYLSGSWQNCTDSDPTFLVEFWNDSGGQPDIGAGAVCSYMQTATIVDTLQAPIAGVYILLYFSMDPLVPECNLGSGWVSIQGWGDTTCWLMIWCAVEAVPGGDDFSWFLNNGVWESYLYDLAICLTGEYVPTYGACCDDSVPVCNDGIEMQDCLPPLRFAALPTTCATLDPPCGTVLGACCLMDGTCAPGLSEAQCTTAGGFLWLANTSCIPNPCPLMNDECEGAIKIDPGQTLSGDTTTATHSSTFPGATTTCGTSAGTNSYDVWYVVTGNGNWLTADLCASSFDTKVQVWKAPCDDPVCVGGNDDACYGARGYTDTLVHHKAARAIQSEYTWCAVSGQDYLIRVYGFSSNTGPYVLEIVDGAPCTGACCYDSDCAITSQADCNGMGGLYLGGGTPCETPDCDGNGLSDTCDIWNGTHEDCQPNGVPDVCDIDSGASLDCQPDGVPDECQLWVPGRYTYIYDDGSTENALAWTDGGECVWLHHFVAQAGGEMINELGTVWGYVGGTPGVVPGQEVHYYIFSDPNGDGSPADGALLRQMDATADAGSIATDVFQWISVVPPLELAPGDSFFIAASTISPPGGYPSPMDQTAPVGGQSWFSGTVGGAWTPGDWTNLYEMGAIGYPCNWLLRAEGGPSGSPPNDCNDNGIPDECDEPTCGNACFEGGAGTSTWEEECEFPDMDVDCPGRCIPPGSEFECLCPFCGDGMVDEPSGEACDGPGRTDDCCTDDCGIEATTYECRPAVDVCDADDMCDGVHAFCPDDAKKAAGTVCRASTGSCDPAEECDGQGDACPADVTITACIDGDGCCPPGCNNNNDNDCAVVCGNGVIEGDEKCDPPDAGECLAAGGACQTDLDCPAGDMCHRYPCNAECQFSDDLIPTVSTWGLVVLALLLLTGAKVYFRRRTA